MGALSDLLRYKDSLVIEDPRSKKEYKIWIRLLGDDDIKEAFRFSRIVSADLRKSLRDKESAVYRDAIAQISEQDHDELIEVIVTARENEFSNEAPAIVDREDLPEIEEIAKLADAPTLEELERLDTATEEQDEEYKKKVEDYINTRVAELRAKLNSLTDEQLYEEALSALFNLQVLQAFMSELDDQKGFRGTYTDEKCTKRGFDTVEEFKDANSIVKEAIIAKYRELEIGEEKLKN